MDGSALRAQAARSRGPLGETVAAAVTLALTWLLLVTAISAGLRLPGEEYLTGYPPSRTIASNRPAGGFIALSERYVERVFGLRPAESVGLSLQGASAAIGDNREAATPPAGGRPSPTSRSVSQSFTVTHPFANDDFANAYVIPGLPFVARTNTRTASREDGEPSKCSAVGGTAWYRYTPLTDESLTADTFRTAYVVALAVYRGIRVTDLQELGCSTSATGNAQVGFTASRGQTYYFQVTGPAGGGELTFELNRAGRTERASESSTGTRDSTASQPSISADGRYVAFVSTATTTDQRFSIPACRRTSGPGPCQEIFVRDLIARTTEMVSVSSSRDPANDDARDPSISTDGRYVSFSSSASNLVQRDTNDLDDIFVHDRLTGVTTRESVTSKGEEAEPPSGVNSTAVGDGSTLPFISGDGRWVVFSSNAPNLSPGQPCTNSPASGVASRRRPQPLDTGGGCPPQLYLRDRLAQTTTLVSATSAGTRANGFSLARAITPDGRYIAFESTSSAWGYTSCGQTATCYGQAYVWDRLTGAVVAASRGFRGEFANGNVGDFGMAISADGRFVAYQSDADNLVTQDTNGLDDAFVFDSVTGSIERVSVSSEGAQQTGTSSSRLGSLNYVAKTQRHVAMSSNGNLVAFDSNAPDLVPNDTNGQPDVFMHDRTTGATTRISISSTGTEANNASTLAGQPAISADGRTVVFTTQADNFDGLAGVFVHVRPSGAQ